MPVHVVRGILSKAWAFETQLAVEELAANIFLFEFSSKLNRDKALDRQPWTVKGYALILKVWLAGCTWQEIDLMTFPVWIQIHGLPLERSNETTARAIMETVGEVLAIEGKKERKLWCVPYIRVKVLLDSRKPLPAGHQLQRYETVALWVPFKFERLAGFYYTCGMMGHMQFLCSSGDDQAVTSVYGPGMKVAGPVPSREYFRPSRAALKMVPKSLVPSDAHGALSPSLSSPSTSGRGQHGNSRVQPSQEPSKALLLELTTPQAAGGAPSGSGVDPLGIMASGTTTIGLGAVSTVIEASSRKLHSTAMSARPADRSIEEWGDEAALDVMMREWEAEAQQIGTAPVPLLRQTVAHHN